MPVAREVKDVCALVVPPKLQADAARHAAGEQVPRLLDVLGRVARQTIVNQYADNPEILSLVNITTEWLITRTASDIEGFQPGDGCPACIAGNDQARAFLREYPERFIALGNLVYTEVWRD